MSKRLKKSYNTIVIFFNVCLLLTLNSCQQQKDILFTDTFESYQIGAIPAGVWQKSGNGTVIIDNTKAFSGEKSVHFVSGEGYSNRAFISLDHIFPISKNTYFGKMKMFVEKASPDGIHWTMIQSSGKVENENFRAEVRYGGQHSQKLMANYDTQGVKTDCWQHSEVKIPEERWFDVQWHFDGAKNTMQFWLDGNLIEDLTVIEKGEGCLENETNGIWQFPVFEDVTIGWVDYQTGGGIRNVWIDDVIISTTKISLE